MAEEPVNHEDRALGSADDNLHVLGCCFSRLLAWPACLPPPLSLCSDAADSSEGGGSTHKLSGALATQASKLLRCCAKVITWQIESCSTSQVLTSSAGYLEVGEPLTCLGVSSPLLLPQTYYKMSFKYTSPACDCGLPSNFLPTANE